MRKFLSILLLPLLIACENTDQLDLEAPSFHLETPIFGQQVFHRDSVLHVKGSLTDESGLSEAYLFIHSGLDGHSHGRVTHFPWLKEAYFELGGALTYELAEEINMPKNLLGGPYHFEMHAVDVHGNATSHAAGNSVAQQIIIIRDDQPSVELLTYSFENNVLNLFGDIIENTHEITFIAITISQDNSGHLGYLENEEYLVSKFYGQSKYLTTRSGILISGDSLEKNEEGNVSLNSLLGEMEIDQSSTNLLLKISVEDELGNVSLFQTNLN